MTKKNIELLNEEDAEQSSVWKYVPNHTGRTVLVSPMTTRPLKNLDGKVVLTKIELANGMQLQGMLGNIDPENPELTKHFLTLSVLRDGKWFHLSRYHDIDYKKFGPKKLAIFLGLNVTDVFPIKYDISGLFKIQSNVLSGLIPEEPDEKLSRDDIIALAVP